VRGGRRGHPGEMNEDCLYLNVWSPRLESGAKLPVMVWIAGDDVLPKGVFESFMAGEALGLPLIIGHTSDDVSVVFDSGLTEESMIKLSARSEETLVAYYPDLEQDPEKLDTTEIGRRVGRDGFFAEVTNRIAHAHAKRGAAAWQYYYDYTAEGLRPTVTKGARHGDDVVFTMNTLLSIRPLRRPLRPPSRSSSRRGPRLCRQGQRVLVPVRSHRDSELHRESVLAQDHGGPQQHAHAGQRGGHR
jgi:carboxylesterase type B